MGTFEWCSVVLAAITALTAIIALLLQFMQWKHSQKDGD